MTYSLVDVAEEVLQRSISHKFSSTSVSCTQTASGNTASADTVPGEIHLLAWAIQLHYDTLPGDAAFVITSPGGAAQSNSVPSTSSTTIPTTISDEEMYSLIKDLLPER